MHLRGRALFRRALVMSVLSAATVMVVVAPASADRSSRNVPSAEQHCVAAVVAQQADGQMTLSEETCYGTFAEAMADVSAGTVDIPLDLEGTDVFTDELIGTMAARFTLGIHYDGYGGSGSSISITGTSCSGGYWNASGWWRNRINSSYNGCYHLRHYNNPNKSGSSYNTYTAGQTDSLSWFANKTESVAYYAW